LGYLVNSDAKSDVTFLLGDSEFLQGRRNFARMSRSFRDLTRHRQTTDDRQTESRQTTDAATGTEGSHTVSVRA